jgi:hypothetical protein
MPHCKTAIAARWFFLGAICLSGAPADADWDFVPQIDLTAESNDNPRLLNRAAIAALGIDDEPATRLYADFRLRFENSGPRGEALIEPAIRSDAYMRDENEALESNDFYLRSRGEHRWIKSSAGYSIDLARERILGTEFLSAASVASDIDDPPVVDSVLLGNNERRRRAVISPYVETSIGERTSFRLDLRLLDADYESDVATGRSDFDDQRAEISIIRDLSERGAVSGGVYGSRFEAAANRNLTDTTGVAVGYARDVSQQWAVEASVGAERSEFRYIDADAVVPVPVTGSDSNLAFNVGLSRTTEISRADIVVGRSVNPDSFGFLTARNELRTGYRRDLTPRLAGGLALRFIDTSGLESERDVDRDYGRVELDLSWDLDPRWALISAYTYSRYKTATPRASAHSNALSVGFRYRAQS